jgi:hypothetical protein
VRDSVIEYDETLYEGVECARITESMESLPTAAYKLLGVLRRIIPDETRRAMTQAEIAAESGMSRGTVASALKVLDGRFIRIHSHGKGRGKGCEIEMLLPPELREEGSSQ